MIVPPRTPPTASQALRDDPMTRTRLTLISTALILAATIIAAIIEHVSKAVGGFAS